MSTEFRKAAIDSFRAAAILAYQTGSKLRGAVMFNGGLQSKSHRFVVVGPGKATRRASSADVIPSGTPIHTPVITLEPRESSDYLDQNDDAITNTRLIRPLGEKHGKAVARSVDEDIIDALNTYAGSVQYVAPGVTAANMTVASGSAGVLNSKALREAKSRLMDTMDDEDPGMYYCAFPASSWDDLMGENEMTSGDYVSDKPTMSGIFSRRYGLTLIPIGARTEQGGSLPANRAFVWHKNAVGLAQTGKVNRSYVEWIGQKRSWLVGSEVICGAARIQAAGVVTVNLA